MSVSAGLPIRACMVLFCVFVFSQSATAQFTAPTQEELSLTSQPEVPGADAVLLLREEVTEDKLYSWTTHIRLKVLTEAGRKYAHVEVGQARWLADPGQWQQVHGYRVAEIEARTIHPDGKVIPFNDGPSLKEVKPVPTTTRGTISFDLPDVTVGSIVEYSYSLVNSDNLVFTPHWEVQSELFTRKEHFLWRPLRSDRGIISVGGKKGREVAESIGWLPILPKDASFSHTTLSGTGNMAGEYGQTVMELKIQNVPPTPKESYMPPIANVRYRVQFYYTAALSGEQYWKDEGKRHLDVEEEFVGPGPKVTAAVAQIVGPSDTEEQKLRKIYAAVMQVENMTSTRGFLAGQDQAHNITPPKTTDDLWEHKAGHSDQITELFVAMARAAGFKAYLMDVANRRRNLFDPNYLSFGQLGDLIAIVKVGGAEQFFDPDEPLCPYGQLAWPHSATAGVREESGGGVALAQTPAQSYKDSRTLRVADVAVDQNGIAAGTVKLTWTGSRALELRQISLRGDNTALQKELQTEAAKQMPEGMSVEIDGIANVDEYEKPLTVSYKVKGLIGRVNAGRIQTEGSLFEARTKPRFASEVRQTPVYFAYPFEDTDAVRITFAKGVTVKSVPAAEKLKFQDAAAYSFSVDSAEGSVTFRRDLVVGSGTQPVNEYPQLRGFFEQLEKKDKEPAVFELVGK